MLRLMTEHCIIPRPLPYPRQWAAHALLLS